MKGDNKKEFQAECTLFGAYGHIGQLRQTLHHFCFQSYLCSVYNLLAQQWEPELTEVPCQSFHSVSWFFSSARSVNF